MTHHTQTDTQNHFFRAPDFFHHSESQNREDPDQTLSTLLTSFCFLNKGRFYPLPKWMME